MTTMIEKVARAIFEACNRQDPVAGFGYADADGGKTVLDGAYDLTAIARAAITAMREPTDGMDDAAYDSDALENGSSAYGCWQAMIDAALAEEPQE